MLSDELLPCPFCGDERVIPVGIRDGRGVQCCGCGAAIDAYHPDALAKASAKWNTRAALTTRMGSGEDVVVTREQTEHRTAAAGIDIRLFISRDDHIHTSAHFIAQNIGTEDPRPYLRRAISTLEAELADVDKCPVHRKQTP